MRLFVFCSVLIAALLQATLWHLTLKTVDAPDFTGKIASLSLAYEPQDPPFRGKQTSPDEIDRDLGLIAAVAGKVRIYTASGSVAEVPRLAQKHKLDVTLGVWLNDELDAAGHTIPAVRAQNLKELDAAIELARQNPNVRELTIGNELLLRTRLEFPDAIDPNSGRATFAPQVRWRLDCLLGYIREAKRRSAVPVSTGEGWSEWAQAPELVREVDFVTTHNLPFWERIPAERAVAHALEKYDLLRGLFPGKRIVIGEFGWPSQGYKRMAAVPSPAHQAQATREFLIETQRRGIDYNLVEAFDQPWKTTEGNVGPYWGIYDAGRNPKFGLSGGVPPAHPWLPVGGIVLGAVVALWGLARRRPTFGHALCYATAANAIGVGVVVAAVYPLDHYLVPGLKFMWGLGFLMLLPLAVVVLAKVNEIAEVAWGRKPVRLLEQGGVRPALPDPAPLVSIHVPAYQEQPEMLKATLDSMARLDYPRFEVLVIVNNTPDERFWKPVERHCAELGPNFKFVYLADVAGFKAGALNLAQKDMDPATAIVAVVDADYQVHPDWLKDLVPWFAKPEVAMIQAPQDHRDGGDNLAKTIMNAEYAGFFDIGMVQRNEDNAIIAHGTMLLIRRSAFDDVGGWSVDTLVEDTELGLRLLTSGLQGHYTRKRYGWGLLPDTFLAYKTQRRRWAYGAMQVIRKHWRHMLPGSSSLSAQQKYHFVTGWTYWFSDALGCAVSFLNLIWVPLGILADLAFPPLSLTVPLLMAVLLNLAHTAATYAYRVGLPKRQIPGAALAAMSLQYTVARAVVEGMMRDNLAFERTEKGGSIRRKTGDRPVQTETAIGLLLLGGALWLWLANSFQVHEQYLFALIVLIQSIPFLCATLMGLIEDARNRDRRKPVALPRR